MIGKLYIKFLKIINNDLGTLSFKQDSSGNWGYCIGGADTVNPFKYIPENYKAGTILKGRLDDILVNGNSSGGFGETDVTITFDPPFKQDPVNVYMWCGDESDKYYHKEYCFCVTMTISKSEATIRIRYKAPYNILASFSWEAIGFIE